MKQIFSIALHDTNNIGDRVSSPLDYFKFPIKAEKIDAAKGDFSRAKGAFIIYGGGGLIHLPSPDYNNGVMEYLEDVCNLSPWLVSWGVGHNIHHSTKIEYPKSFVKKFKLHGVRDVNQALPWVPCVSCMSPLFHHKYKIKRDIVAVGHDLSDFNYPTMEHTSVTLKEIVKFIASGSTVITNSYHGAYWGMLLNRKVIVFDPMSSKFYGLPEEVELATPDTWENEVKTVKANKGFLAKCRRINREYHKKVLSLIEEYNEI